jgi:hypothetical protein
MFSFRPGPFRSAPKSRQSATQPYPGTVVFKKAGGGAGDLCGVTARKEIRGRLANSFTVLCALVHPSTPDRYYIQLKNKSGSVVATAISNSGLTGLPAAAAANSTMADHLVVRVAGSWGSGDTLTPTVHTNFSGGRGPSK